MADVGGANVETDFIGCLKSVRYRVKGSPVERGLILPLYSSWRKCSSARSVYPCTVNKTGKRQSYNQCRGISVETRLQTPLCSVLAHPLFAIDRSGVHDTWSTRRDTLEKTEKPREDVQCRELELKIVTARCETNREKGETEANGRMSVRSSVSAGRLEPWRELASVCVVKNKTLFTTNLWPNRTREIIICRG